MKIYDFMIDFFKDEDMVRVNAVELQNLLKNYDKLKYDKEILNCRIDTLETLLEIEKEKNKQLQQNLPTVDLKI